MQKGTLLVDLFDKTLIHCKKDAEVEILKTNILRFNGTMNLTRIKYAWAHVRGKKLYHITQIKADKIKIIN